MFDEQLLMYNGINVRLQNITKNFLFVSMTVFGVRDKRYCRDSLSHCRLVRCTKSKRMNYNQLAFTVEKYIQQTLFQAVFISINRIKKIIHQINW